MKRSYGLFWIIVGFLVILFEIFSKLFLYKYYVGIVPDATFIAFLQETLKASSGDLIIFLVGVFAFLYGIIKAVFLSGKLAERDQIKLERLLEKERDLLPEDAANFKEIKFISNPNDKFKTQASRIANLIKGIFEVGIGIFIIVFTLINTSKQLDLSEFQGFIFILIAGAVIVIFGVIALIRHFSGYTFGKDSVIIIDRDFMSRQRVGAKMVNLKVPVTDITLIKDHGEYIVVYYKYKRYDPTKTFNKYSYQNSTIRLYKEGIVTGDINELNAYIKSLNKHAIRKATKQRVHELSGFDKVKGYGITAIIFSIIAIALSIPLSEKVANLINDALIPLVSTSSGTEQALKTLLLPFFATAVGLVVGIIILYFVIPVIALAFGFAQIKCNKKAFSIISFLISLGSFITSMVLLIYNI